MTDRDKNGRCLFHWLVFGRIPDEGADWDLYAVRADGECEVQLTDTPGWERSATWHGAGDGGLAC